MSNIVWLDFNDAADQPSEDQPSKPTTQEIKQRLLERLPDVLGSLLPRGVTRGNQFLVGDLNGNRGKSLVSINREERMTELTVLKQRLSEAEEALHQLLTGQKEASVNVGGFGSITYSAANQSELVRYIAQLKLDIRRQERGIGRRALFVEF